VKTDERYTTTEPIGLRPAAADLCSTGMYYAPQLFLRLLARATFFQLSVAESNSPRVALCQQIYSDCFKALPLYPAIVLNQLALLDAHNYGILPTEAFVFFCRTDSAVPGLFTDTFEI